MDSSNAENRHIHASEDNEIINVAEDVAEGFSPPIPTEQKFVGKGTTDVATDVAEGFSPPFPIPRKWFPFRLHLSGAWKHAIIVFLVVRILASLTGFIGVSTVPNNAIVSAGGYSKPKYPKTMEMIVGIWERSDALWYIHLARDGYKPKTQDAAFMPLYPLLIRLIKKLTGLHWIKSALLISNLSCLFAFYFLYRIAEIEKNKDVASRTVWYQALYPGSLFLMAPYTEPLYLALATGSFLAARTRRWWLAGIAGAFLGATRNLGILIFIPLIVEFIRQRREKPTISIISWKKALWLLLVPIGLGAVMMFWWLKSGDPIAFVNIQTGWQRSFMLPWTTLFKGIHQAWDCALASSGGIYIMEATAVIGAVVLGIISFRVLPLSYSLFLWLNLLPPLFAPYHGRMFMSCTRFVAVLFPVFLTLACVVKHRVVHQALQIIFAGLFGLSVALYVASQNMF